MLSEVECVEIEGWKGSKNQKFCYKGFNVRDGLTKGMRKEDSESKSFLGRRL